MEPCPVCGKGITGCWCPMVFMDDGTRFTGQCSYDCVYGIMDADDEPLSSGNVVVVMAGCWCGGGKCGDDKECGCLIDDGEGC